MVRWFPDLVFYEAYVTKAKTVDLVRKEDKVTKRSKFIASAMAGAMMTGTLAVSMPVFAENTTITEESYTLVISTSKTVSDATGFNTLEVTVKNCSIDVCDVTVTAASDNSWQLVSGENAVSYGLYDADDSENAVTEHTFADCDKITSSDGETWNCGIKLTDYSDTTLTGEYTDTITWTAEVNVSEDAEFENDLATPSDMRLASARVEETSESTTGDAAGTTDPTDSVDTAGTTETTGTTDNAGSTDAGATGDTAASTETTGASETTEKSTGTDAGSTENSTDTDKDASASADVNGTVENKEASGEDVSGTTETTDTTDTTGTTDTTETTDTSSTTGAAENAGNADANVGSTENSTDTDAGASDSAGAAGESTTTTADVSDSTGTTDTTDATGDVGGDR